MKLEIVAILFVLVLVSMSQVFAEQQDLWIATLVQSDPYYFSEYGFGPTILKATGYPLEQYLVPGVTDENSSRNYQCIQ